MRFIAAAICAALCVPGTLQPALAQDVTLISRDKSIEISGNLLGFDGTFYRVDTVYGELTVDGTGVLCEGPACPNLEAYVAEIAFSGTPAIGRVLLPALIEAFARGSGFGIERIEPAEGVTQYELVSENGAEAVGIFTIKQTSNDEGFADILSNEADVAMALRPASTEEILFASEAGYGDLTSAAQHDVVAMDALVPNVDLNSSVSEMTMEQVGGLLNGSIRSWREIGENSDTDVQVVLTGPINDVFQPISVVLAEYGLAAPSIPAVQVLENSQLSVGFDFASTNLDERRPVSITDACGIVYALGPQAIKTMEYPLTVPMYFYRPMRRLPKIGQDFFDFLDGQTARRVVERAGYQAVDASESSVEEHGRRLANAIALASTENLDALQAAIGELKERRLLSLVFRFEDGDYDANSSTSMKRLVRLAEGGVLDGQSLLFAGFGKQADKAKMVAADFTNAFPIEPGIVEVESRDFGSVLPVACPETARGDHMNSRVEIWVK